MRACTWLRPDTAVRAGSTSHAELRDARLTAVRVREVGEPADGRAVNGAEAADEVDLRQCAGDHRTRRTCCDTCRSCGGDKVGELVDGGRAAADVEAGECAQGHGGWRRLLGRGLSV